jgi:uncharacterized membrane-anchored protein
MVMDFKILFVLVLALAAGITGVFDQNSTVLLASVLIALVAVVLVIDAGFKALIECLAEDSEEDAATSPGG